MVNSLIYIAATLAANYTATWFIPFPIFGQVAVGTFIFGLTFTQRDRIHVKGRGWIYGTIAAAALANSIMAALLGVPGRIIVASFVAIMIAESTDTEIFDRLRGRSWLSKVAVSNAVSVPLDTLLFTSIAFAGVLPPLQLASLVFGESLLKYAIGALSAVAPTPQRSH